MQMSYVIKNINLYGEQQRALDVMLSGKNVFLSGKGGCGKSFIVHEFIKQCPRQLACLAPTGLAALNIAGATIHSFFHFPIGVLSADTVKVQDLRQKEVIQAIDVILIDEISMVRSDTFQAIDTMLRLCAPDAQKDVPFGGKQIIVVGDFFQLAPVVTEADIEEYLGEEFGGIYAFDTPAWKDAAFENIVLQHVHRQTDKSFLKILNAMRTGELMYMKAMVIYERCVGEDFSIDVEADYMSDINKICRGKAIDPDAVSLCTTRAAAMQINRQFTDALDGLGYKFTASIWGYFPPETYPVNNVLYVKVGMRVMLRANYYCDGDCQYVNGDIGVVIGYNTGIRTEVIVQLISGKRVSVRDNLWQSYRYDLINGPDGKRSIRQRINGCFKQMPLEPAYAMTVHKAQGQTLEAVNLVLGRGCFAPGQLYTALSRCRSMDRLSFDRKITWSDSIVDEKVVEFYANLKLPYEPSCAMRYGEEFD